MFSIGLCVRYQADPRKSHLLATKKIIKYVKGKLDYGVWYDRDMNCELIGYRDADWVENVDDIKSTSCGCFYIGKNLVSWLSKK